MIFRREVEDEAYTILLNFSFGEIKLPKKAAGFSRGARLVSTAGWREVEGKFLPWEEVLLKR